MTAIAVDSTNVTALSGSNESQALTSRVISCESVALFPASENDGAVYLVDTDDDTKRIQIGATGRVVPISDPRAIKVAAATSGDDVEWFAV